MPYYPRQDKGDDIPYTLSTRPEKLVMDYCHINIYEVQEMEIDIYLFFLREAMIFENSQTDEGRNTLEIVGEWSRQNRTVRDCGRILERKGVKKWQIAKSEELLLRLAAILQNWTRPWEALIKGKGNAS